MNMVVVLLGFQSFDNTNSMGYPPRGVAYTPWVPHSTLVAASRFLAGNREADLKHRYFFTSTFLCISIAFIFLFCLLPLYSSLRRLVIGLRYSSVGLILRLLPSARSPCAATRVAEGE